MIVPTIGRVVWVTRHDSRSDQKEPALISYVWSDTLINVGGFDRDGRPFSDTSVILLQDNDSPPASRTYAEWMPYQKSVAR